MMYELLLAYREYLESKYSKETARIYCIRLRTLFKGQSIINTKKLLDIDKILNNLATITHKNYFSQSKNAFIHFCEFQNIYLPTEVTDMIEQLENDTRKKYRKLETVDYKQIQKKIKYLKNKKLKLCYQTIVATGLRVSELAGITSNDCIVLENAITLSFIAKGGTREEITIYKNEYPRLYQNIKELKENTKADKRLFYSAIYLQIKAKELGFKCHDLRRAYAKLEYKKCRSKVEVMKKLRQTSLKNTDIYLKSRVKI